MSSSPTLRTRRLLLRRLWAEDASAMFHYRSSDEVARFQGWRPESLLEVENFIGSNAGIRINEVGEWVQLALIKQESNTLIGDCGLHFLDGKQVEIGISVSPEYQQRGFASEALTAVLLYLFHDLGKHRVTASVDPDNQSSLALLRKLGMRQEAHHVLSYWFRDRWVDDVVFAILAAEFSAAERL